MNDARRLDASSAPISSRGTISRSIDVLHFALDDRRLSRRVPAEEDFTTSRTSAPLFGSIIMLGNTRDALALDVVVTAWSLIARPNPSQW